jgi:Putative lumazine-binding
MVLPKEVVPKQGVTAMNDHPAPAPLLEAVERYLALMYDNDISRFAEVFAPSAQLHGLRDGKLHVIPAADYRKRLAERASPRSKNAPRLQEVLLVDFASPTQAVVKVRVRIDTQQYLDQLSWHCIDGAWRITAKSFHVERTYEAAAS